MNAMIRQYNKITVDCQRCQKSVRVDATRQGRWVACHHCREPLFVPVRPELYTMQPIAESVRWEVCKTTQRFDDNGIENGAVDVRLEPAFASRLDALKFAAARARDEGLIVKQLCNDDGTPGDERIVWPPN